MLPPEYHETPHNPHKPHANLSNVNDTSYDSACVAADGGAHATLDRSYTIIATIESELLTVVVKCHDQQYTWVVA